MNTRSYAVAALAMLTVGCSSAAGAVAGANTGAGRLGSSRSQPATQWGGETSRTASFSVATFNYIPPQQVAAPPEAVKDVAITFQGNVTIRLFDPLAEAIKGELTAAERDTLVAPSLAVRYAYRNCPRSTAADQPRFVWQMNGSNNEFLPDCAGNSFGITAILNPELVQTLTTFVKAVVLRLANRDVG